MFALQMVRRGFFSVFFIFYSNTYQLPFAISFTSCGQCLSQNLFCVLCLSITGKAQQKPDKDEGLQSILKENRQLKRRLPAL